MEKYIRLSLPAQKELLGDFAQALLSLKTEDDAIKFLVDLLTKEEVIKLAKRIKIAQFILEGREYRAIEQALRVSHSTIAKVAYWLREGGDGFKVALKNAKKHGGQLTKSEMFDSALMTWKKFKRKYPSMFWPSLLVEGILNSADEQDRKEIYRSLQKLDKKSKIYKEANAMYSL
ncbi:MAG: YerC/YecD family TrpR-related protein [Patescibacteria group bacterium]|nr:YerC/YecD family TrpR-related protein [Patescibacteria group bacterium]